MFVASLMLNKLSSRFIDNFSNDRTSKVVENFNNQLKRVHKSSLRPSNWGGFSFTPFYFEFWEGHESRINKREAYELQNGNWIHSILQA